MDIEKHILEIKRLVGDLDCMGTYGLVELELNEIEKLIKPKPAYLVSICQGQFDDYTEHEVFVTASKDMADKWCSRFNKIIDENLDRIKHYYHDDKDYSKPELFWYNFIYWETPFAKSVEVEQR